MGIDEQFDVFISHASEDKARFVEPLVAALRERGIQPWYDTEQIRLGDDFRRKMDEGLWRARFGVVILSPRFFKCWPEAELSALFAQEAAFDQTRILPIRCDLDRATLMMRSPLLAARADVGWEMGVPIIADRIRDRVRDAAVGSRIVLSPVYNLPSRRARQLFGREADLQQLDALLVPGRSVQVAASIEGLAGVGKTELALHIVNRLSRTGRFPGGIFWFDAENPNLTTTWGSTIADALAIGAGTIEERAAAAIRIASSGAPILIVLDNVNQWTHENAPKPLPSGLNTALLVTTRHKFLGGRSFDHHILDILPAEAARELLVSAAGRDLSQSSGTEDLLSHLDGNSLAIELAGAYLQEFPSVTSGEYLRQLEEGLPVGEKVQDRVRYKAVIRSVPNVESRLSVSGKSRSASRVLRHPESQRERSSNPKRDRVFISYSHKDLKYLEELKTMLAPVIRSGLIDVWDDKKIDPGAQWKDEIEAALGSAKIALLLVSQNFLASNFIAHHELRPLLAAAEEKGVHILWIYLSYCMYEHTEIATYQAAHDLEKPLNKLGKPQREKVLRDVCANLIRIAQDPR